jgi:DNA repair photolyase
LHTERPEDFSQVIKVKGNAAELLRKELKKVKKGVVATGDYQPAEKLFGLSRKMLKVVRDCGFPVHVVEKSDLVIKDLDVLQEIDEQTWVCVSFSFSTVDEDVSGVVEPVAPSPRRRLKAMREIADAGIVTGANLMPVLPFVTDSAKMIEDVVRAVHEHGGTFVLVGGLTLDNNVRTRYFTLLKRRFPELLHKYEDLYRSDIHQYNRETAVRAQKICETYGLKNRIPRYCLNFNQRVAERLFAVVYQIELEEPKKAWAYRKVAWAVDELDNDIRDIKDLTVLPGVGEKMAALIEEIIEDL